MISSAGSPYGVEYLTRKGVTVLISFSKGEGSDIPVRAMLTIAGLPVGESPVEFAQGNWTSEEQALEESKAIAERWIDLSHP